MNEKEKQIARDAKLWHEYKARPTLDLKNMLAEKYTPLVYKIAKKYSRTLPKVLDFGDIVQAGKIGLLDAIDRFDPDNERKAQFQTYAVWRIQGSIIDEINSMDWTPRSARQMIKRVLRARDQHILEENEDPTVADLMERTELEEEQVKETLQQMNKTYITPYENEIIDFIAPATDHSEDEMKSDIEAAMNKALTDKEKEFIELKFFRELSNQVIMDTLGIKASEMRTLKEAAIKKLKKELGDDEDDDSDNL